MVCLLWDGLPLFSEPSAARSMLSAWDLLTREGLVDENDIIPDLLDALPRNAILLSPAEQPEEAIRSRNDEGGKLSVRQPAFHVAHIAQAAAVADVDDLLAAEVGKAAVHCAFPPVP